MSTPHDEMDALVELIDVTRPWPQTLRDRLLRDTRAVSAIGTLRLARWVEEHAHRLATVGPAECERRYLGALEHVRQRFPEHESDAPAGTGRARHHHRGQLGRLSTPRA